MGNEMKQTLTKLAISAAVNQWFWKSSKSTQLFIEQPNWSSFEKWQIILIFVEPGCSTKLKDLSGSDLNK